MYANQLINEAEVQKTWGPIIEEATGITEKSKLSWMSKYCHYHNLNESVYNTVHLNPNMNVQSMGNATLPGNPGAMNAFPAQVQGSGDRPFSLLPLAMQVAAQTVGLDLVPVVPMQGPMGVLTYLDFVYGGGRGSGAPLNGALDTTAAPLLIKFSVANTDASAFVVNDVYYADPIAVPTVAQAVGAAYELTYVGASRIDGLQIFRVRANTTALNTAAGTAGNSGFNYAQGAETASGTIYNSIIQAGRLYGLARVGGVRPALGAAIVGFGIAGTNAVAQVTATAAGGSQLGLVKALEDHITGFSGNAFQPTNNPTVGGPGFATENANGNDPYLRGVGESTPDNVMGLSLFNKSIAAQTFQVAAAVTREQVQDLKQFGIDAVAQVEAVLVNELTQSINKYILDRIFRNGATNATNTLAVDGLNLSAAYTTAAGAANVAIPLGAGNNSNVALTVLTVPTQVGLGGETQGSLQRRLYTKVLAASNLIATRGRRGPATFAVTSGEIATALQDVAGFIAYPLSNTINQSGGSLYPIGSLAGVTVYVDPNMAWTDYRIAVGRKGDGNSPGLVFMPYLMAESVETIAEGTMAPKIAVKSRFALVDAGFHPETMYYTIGFNFAAGVNIL
jgi:hypothetical protein